MLLFCYINLVKFEKFCLFKILEMTYNLERREYIFFPTEYAWWLEDVSSKKRSREYEFQVSSFVK